MMVAMVIAIIVLLAVSQVYVSGVKTQTGQQDAIRLNESARFAFDLLGRELRQAGYRNTWQLNSTSQNFCATQSAGGHLVSRNDPSQINPVTADFSGSPQTAIYSPATNSYNDVIRVRYYGEDSTATTSVVDCHGHPVANNQLVEDTLYIAQDTANNNEPSLFCNTTNPSPASATHPGKLALVAGVESLQLLYGEDTDADGIVNRFVPWHLVTNADNIVSVKASIIVRSPNLVIQDVNARPALTHFSPNYPAVANTDGSAIFPANGATVPADGRARLMLSKEIAVRNFAYCG
jgi:type IV pilus assembly protein PilW